MTRIPKKRRLPKDERRAQLVQFAVIVAARKGIGRLAHAEVAREAGVSVPTVFLYFENRVALVTAVIEEVERFYVHQYSHSLEQYSSPQDGLRDLLLTYSKSVETHPQYAQTWLEWSIAIRNEAGIWDSFQNYQETMIAKFAIAIRRGQRSGLISREVSAVDAARLVVAAAYTITQLKHTARSHRSVERFIDQVIKLALHP
ncbi:MAG: TetR/AcrR family transcriptional regulator [Gammaproteobacteria bacterium]|nr:TetR/AcrR family transcriptional regulator [Gammaproteobacteria bacterium]